MAVMLLVGPSRDGFAAAAGAAEPRKDIEALDKMVTEAAKLFVQKKYQEAGTAARRAQERMEELASGADADAITALDAVYQRLAKAYALLELEGISLPPLKKPGAGDPAKPSAADEALNAQRAEQALKNWRLVVTTTPPNRQETDHFLLLGDVSAAVLQKYAETAEAVLPKVAAQLDVPSDRPLLNGRITLFVCAERRAYLKFGKLVERRDLPAKWPGHWRHDTADCYAIIDSSSVGLSPPESLLVEQIAGLHVASLGKVPRWFAEGAARMTAAKLHPQDAGVAAWEQTLPDVIIESLATPDDLVNDRLRGEAAAVAGFGFVKFLAADAKRYQALWTALRSGKSFEAAFASAFRGPPAQLVQTWLKQPAAANPN